MSTVRKSRKLENALFPRLAARARAAFGSLEAFLRKVGVAGRRRLTIMLIPHTEKRILNVQLSFFALAGILLAAGVVVLAFLFSAARFSATANRLQSSSSDLASTKADLESIRDQAGQLVTSAKRFESALSGTLGRIGTRPSSATSPAQSGDFASFFESGVEGSGSAREIGELQKVTDYLERSIDTLNQLGSLLQGQSVILTEVPNIWPVKGAGYVAVYYGQNENPLTGQWYLNEGIDISTRRAGDPVLATADGKVSAIGYDAEMGNYLVIQHSHGFSTRYAHLMAFRVAKGQKVKQGQPVGVLGSTGLATGPQLHYEVRLGTGVIDPLRFLNIRSAQAAGQ